MAMPWRCPMALPRDDSVFSGHIFDSVGTLGRYVNSAAAIVATAASTGLVNMHFTACKKGAATERARVHLCHAVPRVTVSCGPLYLLIIIGLRTINDANYSFLLIAYTAVHDKGFERQSAHILHVRCPHVPLSTSRVYSVARELSRSIRKMWSVCG